MKLKALVVDDEAVARRRVARLLQGRDDVELVGQASGGAEALDLIAGKSPDLVFLDVQMPDLDGFEVVRKLSEDPELRDLPAIIFVTAYDQFALRAFESAAVDYLLKPYSPERFEQAVDRALRWMQGGRTRTEQGRKVEQLLRFLVKRRGVGTFVNTTDVDWIESEGNYVRLHVGATSHLVRATLASCVERLDPARFVRIHRRFIVNVDRVKEVQPWFGGDYLLVLLDGRKLRLSRNFRDEFRARMLGD